MARETRAQGPRNRKAEYARQIGKWRGCPYVSRRQVRRHPGPDEIPLSVVNTIETETLRRRATFEVTGPFGTQDRTLCLITLRRPDGRERNIYVPWERMGNLWDVMTCRDIPSPSVFSSVCAVAVAESSRTYP